MEVLVKPTLPPYEPVGFRIDRKEYDIISLIGKIIVLETWEFLLKPGWEIEMRLWTIQEEGQMGPRSEYGTTKVPSMPSSGSLKPPLSSQGGMSSATSSTSTSKKASLKSWFSGRKLSRSSSYAQD